MDGNGIQNAIKELTHGLEEEGHEVLTVSLHVELSSMDLEISVSGINDTIVG